MVLFSPLSLGFPRLIDLETFYPLNFDHNITLGDVIATVLWRHNPEALRGFFDFKNNHFTFIDQTKVTNHPRFCIERNGSRIRCGWRCERGMDEWQTCYEYIVEQSGVWTPKRFEIIGLKPLWNVELIETMVLTVDASKIIMAQLRFVDIVWTCSEWKENAWDERSLRESSTETIILPSIEFDIVDEKAVVIKKEETEDEEENDGSEDGSN